MSCSGRAGLGPVLTQEEILAMLSQYEGFTLSMAKLEQALPSRRAKLDKRPAWHKLNDKSHTKRSW